MQSAYRIDIAGLTLTVRVTPNASKSAFAGLVALPDGPAVAIRIAAPPVDGAANAALIAFLSKQFGVRKSAVTISSGETSRLKQVHIDGDGERFAETLQPLIAPSPADGSGRSGC